MEINGELVNEEVRYADLGLSQALMQAVQKKGYVQATPVQGGAIPYFMEYRDVIAKAPTGTGKTFAFGIPMVEHADPQGTQVTGLVLAPTRELAIQIRDELRDLCAFKEGVRSVCLYGGQPIDKQITQLKKRPQIVVATPGRLLDLIGQGYVTLDTIRFFVLQAHYRSTLDFSNEALKAAQKGYERLMTAVRALDKVKASAGNTVDVDALITQCEEAIDDDLNTPVLISHLFDGVRMINSLVAGNEKIDAGNLAKLKKLYQDYVFDILGLKAESESVSQDHEVLGKILDMVMSIRTEAKQKKDWATSDKIRDELKAAGVAIKDTKEGYEWELVEN